MLFASLGSGSAGNGMLVRSVGGESATTVLVDCGFTLREVEQRLQRLALQPTQINAILITHEHEDHAGGVERLARRYDIPIYLTHGTWRAVRWHKQENLRYHFIEGYQAFQIGALTVQPYPVPHDAKEPAQFVFSAAGKRLGLLTDAGCHTPHISAALQDLHGLVLECNHDLDLLQQSNYPAKLKQRISGPLGHLSNTTAANILRDIIHPGMRHIVAAHLSEKNNSPLHAETILKPILVEIGSQSQLHIACQDKGFGWIDLSNDE